MNRRRFLSALSVAPLAPLAALPTMASIGPGLRIIGADWEEMKDDPGHKLWAQHIGIAGGHWRVWLNGVDQYWVSAADENEGWVRRAVTVGDDPSFGATLCMSGGEWLEEIVYGNVEIIPYVPVSSFKYYPFDTVREKMPYLYSRLKVEGVNCPVGYY